MQRLILAGIFFLSLCAGLRGVQAQNQPSQPPDSNSSPVADYPLNRAGVFIQSASSWRLLANQFPIRTKTAHGIAASLSYGIVPAKVVAEYDGEHAPTRVVTGPVTICICHMISLPGEPVIVRLHAKKDARELDGGKMIVYPVVGGSKMADANKSDLIPVDQSQPDSQVWIIRSQSPLPPGEYALMLGTQNLSIFAFSVAEPTGVPAETKANP